MLHVCAAMFLASWLNEASPAWRHTCRRQWSLPFIRHGVRRPTYASPGHSHGLLHTLRRLADGTSASGGSGLPAENGTWINWPGLCRSTAAKYIASLLWQGNRVLLCRRGLAMLCCYLAKLGSFDSNISPSRYCCTRENIHCRAQYSRPRWIIRPAAEGQEMLRYDPFASGSYRTWSCVYIDLL